MMIKTVQDFLNEARRLKAEAHAAEARFLLFIRTFEIEHERLWKTGGVTCFETFLQSTQLVNVARYRSFCAGLAATAAVEAPNVKDEAEATKAIEPAVVRRGADAMVELGKFKHPTPEAVKQYGEYSDRFVEVHGDSASEQTHREWRKRLDASVPRIVTAASRMAQLRAENEALRAENRELKRKLERAEKELARLRKRVA